MGRQLIKLHLDKNEAAKAGEWILPRVRNPGAKSVRGEIAVASVPGFRFAVGATEKLTEIPISRFQANQADLQLAFRIREREWSATMNIESLPQSVQADVFHLHSLKDQTAYVSVVLNYFITGARYPSSAWESHPAWLWRRTETTRWQATSQSFARMCDSASSWWETRVNSW